MVFQVWSPIHQLASEAAPASPHLYGVGNSGGGAPGSAFYHVLKVITMLI